MEPLQQLWQVALALGLIVVLVIGLGAVARRVQGVRSKSTGSLKILDSAMLGPKERLVLVQVADKSVLLGMNANCITKLTEMPAVEADFAEILQSQQQSQDEAVA